MADGFIASRRADEGVLYVDAKTELRMESRGGKPAWRLKRAAAVLARVAQPAHALALIDQAAVSGASFLATVLIGRWTDSSQLGAYALGLSVIFAALAVQDSLVSLPFAIQAHRSAGAPEARAGSALLHCLAIAAAAASLAIVAAAALSFAGAPPQLSAMAWALALAAPFALTREFGRRFAFARLRMGEAIKLDVAAAALQLTFLAALRRADMISAASAMLALGSAFALTSLAWFGAARGNFAFDRARGLDDVAQSWALGKWLLAGRVAVLTQWYATYWLSTLLVGAAAAGVYTACMSVVSFANPLVSGLGNILTPRAVIAWKERGANGLRRQALSDAALFAAALGAFCVAIYFAGERIMDLLFVGPEYQGHGATLFALALALLAQATGSPASSALASMERPRAIVVAATVGTAFTAALVGALLVRHGIEGAAYGFLVGSVLGAVARWAAFLAAAPLADARQARVLSAFAQMTRAPSAGLGLTALGEGDDAVVVAIRSIDGSPVWGGHDSVAIKLFKPGAALRLEDARAQFDAAASLHAALDGAVIEGWKIATAQPLSLSRAPLAMAMTVAPGQNLSIVARNPRLASDEALGAAARVAIGALRACWARGVAHGDLALQNILCDFGAKTLCFVDGAASGAGAASVESAATRDLADLLCDAVADVKRTLANPGARARRDHFAQRALAAYLEAAQTSGARLRALDAIAGAARARLSTLLPGAMSPRGAWRIYVRRVATRRLSAIALRLRDELGGDVVERLRAGATAPSGQKEVRGRRATSLLPEEVEFYEGYDWSLDPYPTFRASGRLLRAEAEKLARAPNDWRRAEIAVNLYLLAAAMLNCADERLRGPVVKLPRSLAATRPGSVAKRQLEAVLAMFQGGGYLRAWQMEWTEALHGYLLAFVSGSAELDAAAARLGTLAVRRLPNDLLRRQIAVPSPFGRLDLTHHDVVALARRLAARVGDRAQPILLVGLRTSGTYFAPLIHAALETMGFAAVAYLTVEPNAGAGRREGKALEKYARRGFLAFLVDDPPDTAGTLLAAFAIARRHGFADADVKALAPRHGGSADWAKDIGAERVVALEPEAWHMRQALEPAHVQGVLAAYFAAQGCTSSAIVDDAQADAINAKLAFAAMGIRGARLKRVFAVRSRSAAGVERTRLVLAKSVGWGWLGYRAFLAGRRLGGLVPPVLGLRDGVLYVEWVLPPTGQSLEDVSRAGWIEAAAAYAAARSGALALGANPLAGTGQERHHNGLNLLGDALAGASGPAPLALLARARIKRRLRQLACPLPTLIDGEMGRQDWILGPDGLLKADFDRHGLGKAELNVADPAYDLADAALALSLNAQEQSQLVDRYGELTGDGGVRGRLFLHKLLAGLWAMRRAHGQICGGKGDRASQRSAHRDFVRAWDFLTLESARFCGALLQDSGPPSWRAPLVALDIDGVIDARRLGFPCTSLAGVAALATLRRKGYAIALNSARSAGEIEAYCAAYGLAGGVAEYGGYVWDAVAGEGRTLVGAPALRQMEDLRRALENIPGVFLDERHRHSIRAFTYRERPAGLIERLKSSGVGDAMVAPISKLAIRRLLDDMGLDLLTFRQTAIDTTVTAKVNDKGTGLIALRDRAIGPQGETIAVGDGHADLAMFRVATRSFAPANIDCAPQAKLAGCQIVGRRHQRGLLQIAESLADLGGASAPVARTQGASDADRLACEILAASDRGVGANLLRLLLGRI